MDEAKWIGERCVFERDYTPATKLLDTKRMAERRTKVCTMPEIQKDLKAPPDAVDERGVEEFDQMVVACDEIMREFAGRLKVVVDHGTHDASIVMECVYGEFIVGEFMDILLKMGTKALQICFEPTTSDSLRITISMPYV